MKRDDIAIGHAALDMALGTLSPDEEAIGKPFDLDDPHNVETLLYYHLDNARRIRMQLDAAGKWDQGFENKYREREKYIADATRHYQLLLLMGHPIDAYLARLILTEGLTP